MGRTETGNSRRPKAWGQIGISRGVRRRRRTPQKRKRRQRGRGLFSSIGSGTVDRVARHVEGLAPGLIDMTGTRVTRVGKELIDHALNQLIDIPKNRLKGAFSDIERKIIEAKNKAIGGIMGKLLPKTKTI